MIVQKIISGGQTGADIAGLKAGKLLGLLTGGWVPQGCRTLDGPNPALLTMYGCKEHFSPAYPARTMFNVRDSDATIRFAADFHSAGERCTLKAIKDYGKPYLDVDITKPPEPAQVRAWLEANHVKILNVAGNSELTHQGIEAFVFAFLVQVLQKSD